MHVQSLSKSLERHHADSKGRDDETIIKEDTKESFDLYSAHLDAELDAFDVKRIDSNGFILRTGKSNPLLRLPSLTGRSAKYFLQEKIGEGAYGKVYRAIDSTSNDEVMY